MEHEEPDSEPDSDDPLAIAKGCGCGFLICIAVWLLIVGIAMSLGKL